ncbi:MAG: hypothetical protein KC561_07930, partial [Myxococcales bacterium]|nr:hypothetical protein [Myxococcales bacterium]
MLALVCFVPRLAEAQRFDPFEVDGEFDVPFARGYRPASLVNRWLAFQVSEAGSEEESAAFEQFLQARDEVGVTRLDFHARAILQMALAAHEDDQGVRRDQLMDWAGQLSPDL